MLKTIHYFLLIILLAILLRFFSIGAVPPSLNWDEASLGYNAYSILKTGHDEWGRFLPISFEAFGDYKLPGYVYTLVPFIALFGLNEFSVRLLSMVAGVLACWLIFLIVKSLTGSKSWALVSALLLAISPWHVFISRAAFEANLAFTFFLAGFYFFQRGLKKSPFLVLTALFWGVTIFTYNSARIFIPLIFIASCLIYRQELLLKKRQLILPFVIFVFFVALAFYYAVFEDSSSRYYWVSIVDQGAINYLNESRATSVLPDLLTKLFYNRYVYFVNQFIRNYLGHFSLEFLFLEGSTNHQFSVPHVGLQYVIELPFLLFGIFRMWQQKTVKWIILWWLLIAPIPSAITRESPHVLRSIFMLGSLQILVGFGVIQFFELVKGYKLTVKRLILAVVAVLFLGSVVSYFYQYFVIYPKANSESWQYGMREAVDEVLANPDYLNGVDGKKVYFTKQYGEAHMFYLFFSKYDPSKYSSNPTLIRYSQTNWRWVDKLDNIYFVNDWEMIERLKGVSNSLVVTTNGNYPPGSEVIKSIYFLDGSKAFDVVKL